MKKFLILILILCSSCSVFYNRNPRNFHDSMGRINILIKSDNKMVGNGTAFVVGKNLLLTADHVCEFINSESAYKVEVEYFLDGKFLSSEINKIIKRDKKNDLCLFTANEVNLPIFKIANKLSLIGDKVYSYGCASGVFGFLSEGFVTDNAAELADNKIVLIISAPGFFGQSGGPILNEDGYVIGLVSGGFNEFHHIQISPQTEVLIDFVKDFI